MMMATANQDDLEFTVSGIDALDRPLNATDTEIDAAVAEAGLMPLLMAVVHVTGNLDILDQAGATQRPQNSTDLTGGLAPELADRLRSKAAISIKAWRDAGCPAPYHPVDTELSRMIDTLVGKPLAPPYETLLAEELGLDGDARAFHWDRPVSPANLFRLPVLVIGAGLSGIAMGYRLRQAGLPFTIVEKNDGPGGTWFENRFPGARVDVPSHCYSFSFLRDQKWPDLFSAWPVLRKYFSDATDRLGLRSHIRFATEVLRATYDEAAAAWIVTLRADGRDETLRVAAIVSAVGQLNRPSIPAISGEDEFAGIRVHTSRWPDGLSVAGKKVIVVGPAATALQLVPELAREAAELTVFQRSPTWVLVHPEYRRAIGMGEQWAIDYLPGYARWYRAILYNWALDGTPEHMIIDSEWSGGPQAVSAANEAARLRLTKGMREAIGDQPDLLDKLIPNYPPYVKRPNLGDGGFFRAFSQPNVHLNTEGIARFEPDGLVDGAGVLHQADIVVYATGFRALEYLAPMEIVGRGGERIDTHWGDEPRAYLGITVPKFPNLFLMYGPGTNLGFNGNLFFNSEAQAHYIMGCLKWMAQDGLASVEVKQEVYDDYADRMDTALARFTWSHGGTSSWYKNRSGKVIANSPWPLVTYWEWTRAPNPSDYNTRDADVESRGGR
jgi:4-hydroxyacetophenone monooxygenase